MNALACRAITRLPALISRTRRPLRPPRAGGDLIRTPQILPTGRNIHGFDPFRIPSAFAVADGARQAERLARPASCADGNPLPETVAIVLWGTDNLKSEGAPIAQALALLGAKPRFDSYGRLCGAESDPAGRARAPAHRCRRRRCRAFSAICCRCRPKLLAEAAFLAAERRRAARTELRAQACARLSGDKHGVRSRNGGAACVLECRWRLWLERQSTDREPAPGTTKTNLPRPIRDRKSFAYGRARQAGAATASCCESVLADVELTYQNLESVELGVTTVDHYFDTLGGISRAVKRASGANVPVYIGDQTRGEGLVRTLSEQVALETRTRMLNPKWYEGMLKHGYEGVRHIEAHVTNTLGWSATTGQVAALGLSADHSDVRARR